MAFESALAIAIAIIGASIVALAVVVGARRRAAQEEELRQAASARGWTFESTATRGTRVRRWRGTTDGINWTIESVRRTSGKKPESRRHVTRWHTTAGLNPAAPIFCMGVAPGKEIPSFDVAKGDGWIAQMAQKAAGFALDKAIDTLFGDEAGRAVDARTLHRVESEPVPGFVVMAGDVSEVARLLFQGLRAALADINAGAGDELTSVLIYQQGTAIARMHQMESAGELEVLIRRGISLTRASTFGRRSPS
jgi:hypothetical protein